MTNRLGEPFGYLGEFCWQRAWYKTKVSLSSALQMETSTLTLHTGLPCQMPQQSAWRSPGQPGLESAGKGSGQGHRVGKWIAPALGCPRHCPGCGTVHLQGPHRAEGPRSVPPPQPAAAAGSVSCRGSLRSETLGGDRSGQGLGGSGVGMPGPQAQLGCSLGCRTVGTSFNL